jgi:hypothetical protein
LLPLIDQAAEYGEQDVLWLECQFAAEISQCPVLREKSSGRKQETLTEP